MSNELIERMEKAQTYLRYDVNSMRKEVADMVEARRCMKAWETEMKWLIKTIERNKSLLLNPKYQKKLTEVWQAFPELCTIRQVEVILRTLQAKPNAEIARELFISEKGAKWHKTQAYRNLGVKSSYELIKLAEKRQKERQSIVD